MQLWFAAPTEMSCNMIDRAPPKTVKKILIKVFLVTQIIFFLHTGNVNAQSRSPVWNLPQCQLKDHVFVEIGTTILALPYADYTMAAIGRVDKVPPNFEASNATQTLGCYDNPIHTFIISRIEAAFLPEEISWRRGGGAIKDGIELIRMDIARPRGDVSFSNVVVNKQCKDKEFTVNRSEKVSICLNITKSNSIKNREYGSILYQVPSKFFSGLKNQEVYFHCGPNAEERNTSWCQTDFIVNKDINVYLDFYPPKSGDLKSEENKNLFLEFIMLVEKVVARVDSSIQ